MKSRSHFDIHCVKWVNSSKEHNVFDEFNKKIRCILSNANDRIFIVHIFALLKKKSSNRKGIHLTKTWYSINCATGNTSHALCKRQKCFHYFPYHVKPLLAHTGRHLPFGCRFKFSGTRYTSTHTYTHVCHPFHKQIVSKLPKLKSNAKYI